MKTIEKTTKRIQSKMNMGIFVGVLVSLTACAGSSSSTSKNVAAASAPKATVANTNSFKIKFDWEPGMNKCFSRKSPPIQLINVPAGTKSFSVEMDDEDSDYDHGGGRVAYSGGSVIPAGALKKWEGLCPPVQHKYTFKVTAFGGQKARATYSQNYPK